MSQLLTIDEKKDFMKYQSEHKECTEEVKSQELVGFELLPI